MGEKILAIGNAITLAAPIAEKLVPIIQGIVTEIRQGKNAQGEIEYAVVISTGHSNLEEANSAFAQMVANAQNELTR